MFVNSFCHVFSFRLFHLLLHHYHHHHHLLITNSDSLTQPHTHTLSFSPSSLIPSFTHTHSCFCIVCPFIQHLLEPSFALSFDLPALSSFVFLINHAFPLNHNQSNICFFAFVIYFALFSSSSFFFVIVVYCSKCIARTRSAVFASHRKTPRIRTKSTRGSSATFPNRKRSICSPSVSFKTNSIQIVCF